MNAISFEDWVSASNFVGRYNWLLDSGEAAAWADLWAADGQFHGVFPKAVVGRQALMKLAEAVFRDNGKGMMRHLFGNLNCFHDPDGSLRARFYNHVTIWGDEARPFVMSLNEMALGRIAGDWQILSNTVQVLPVGHAPEYSR